MKRSFSINKRARFILCAFCFAIVALALGATGYHFVRTNGEVNAEGAGAYDVDVVASPSNGGTVTGKQTDVEPGDYVAIRATAKEGYSFSKWTCRKESDNSFLRDYNSATATVTMGEFNIKCTAHFILEQEYTPTYTITVSADPSRGGSVSGGQTTTANSQVTIRATANDGYSFSKWTCRKVSDNSFLRDYNSATATVTMGEFNIECTAHFILEQEFILYDVTIYPGDGGKVNVDGILYSDEFSKTVTPGTTVTMVAVADSDYRYRFDKWVCNGEEYTNSNLSLTVNENYSCTAMFEQEYTPGDNTGGNTSGDNTGGDNEGGDNTGGNTSGDNTGGNTSGDNTGGDNTGDNTGGNTSGDNTGEDNTGDNTGGDNTGGNTSGDNTGGDNTGDNTGGNTPGDDDSGEDGDGDNKDDEKNDEENEKTDESTDKSDGETIAVPDTGGNTSGSDGGMASMLFALPVLSVVMMSVYCIAHKTHRVKFN